jgi:hypothetical protein
VIANTPSNITQNNDLGNCSAVVTWTAPIATDNCDVASFVSSHQIGDVFPEGTTTVTYTATDIHNNVSTSSFTVTVNDTENPVISGLPNTGEEVILAISSNTLAGMQGLTDFNVNITSSTSISFDWSFTTADPDGPSFDPFGYILNGQFVQLTNDMGPFTQNGSTTINLGTVASCTASTLFRAH